MDRAPAPAHGLLRLLARLARDTGGNTLMIVAAALLPLLAMIGGGIDMGRGYVVQTRLQHACDAGVLAARKRLGTQAAVDDLVPDEVAAVGERFFDVNFPDGDYGTEQRQFNLVLENDYSITGEASIAVPTTLMTIFGYSALPVEVNCRAQITMSNTDVMMVLDTTGSMDWINPGDTVPRIDALRSTVKSFHAQLEANKPHGTRIRYGFVPYSTNVNVGYLLDDDWMVDSWSYNSRAAQTSQSPAVNWRYRRYDVDLDFLQSSDTRTFPIGGIPAETIDLDVSYRGCIEERDTYEINDYNNVDLDRALDLDIDRVPDPNDAGTQWRPMLNELSFIREVRLNGRGFFTPGNVNSPLEFVNAHWSGFSACPSPAMKLSVMDAAQIASYVDNLEVRGSTYHDIGMIWGGRLLSPTGLFAAQNADVSPGQPTTRHLIFLTDGETSPLDISYGTYGIEPLDRRRWKPSSSMTLTQTVENRFSFACEQVKNRNITVWVISFGVGANPVMQNCAGTERYFVAANAAELQQVFSDIANRMSELRMTH